MPVDELMKAVFTMPRGTGGPGFMRFGPVLDPATIPQHPGDALAARRVRRDPAPHRHHPPRERDVPRVTSPSASSTTPRCAHDLAPVFGDRLDEVLDTFRRGHPDASATELYLLITSTSPRLSSIELAERKLAGGTAPVWMYLLAWESPALDGFVRASHGMCVPLTMDTCESMPATQYPAGARPRRRR